MFRVTLVRLDRFLTNNLIIFFKLRSGFECALKESYNLLGCSTVMLQSVNNLIKCCRLLIFIELRRCKFSFLIQFVLKRAYMGVILFIGKAFVLLLFNHSTVYVMYI